MAFDELNDATREVMMDEWVSEQLGGNPFRPAQLSDFGHGEFPNLVKEALATGDEVTLTTSLAAPRLWRAHVNVQASAARLGLTEFNTWYVRGLSGRLLAEGVRRCRIYRAGPPAVTISGCECSQLDGKVVDTSAVYEGHRARYWSVGNRTAFSVPPHPNCHHTIGRA